MSSEDDRPKSGGWTDEEAAMWSERWAKTPPLPEDHPLARQGGVHLLFVRRPKRAHDESAGGDEVR